MKNISIALMLCVMFFTSCKDANTNEEDSAEDATSETYENSDLNQDREDASSTSEMYDSENAELKETPLEPDGKEDNDSNTTKASSAISAGNFIKLGEENDNSCACYCINVNYTSNSELCLTPSKMYVNIRMAKAGNQMTNIFLVNPSAKNSEGKDIPWDKFDKNAPIATLTSKPNGEVEMDWLGFSINGDLAIDYAILGKKTLEGTYKKK